MVDIRVSPERLRSVASTLDRNRQEADSALRNMVNAINNLQGEWTGMAQIDYVQLFNDRVPVMQLRLGETLEGLVCDLRRIADEFERVDQQVGHAGTAGTGSGGAGEQGSGKQGDEPITQFPYPPGSDQWTEADKSGDCWRYAYQRSGGRLRNCPDGYARSLTAAYPPEQQFALNGSEQDLRDHIQPGMAIVWAPPDSSKGGDWPAGRSPLYGVDSSGGFTPPSEGGYYADCRYASDLGHVGIVEEVGRDYIVVSDQYGRHRIDQHGNYMHNGPKNDVNFLVGPTFINLS